MFFVMSFSTWILNEMKLRQWSQADLSRASGLTPTAISNLITVKRNPGKDSCIALAIAFKLPPEIVFREAGILEADPEKDERLYKIETLYRTLREEGNKERALQFLEFLSGLEDKNDRTGKKSK